MNTWIETIITIVCAVLASSGFWAWMQKRHESKDVKAQVLLGLGHDRIVYLGLKYIERGWITQDEYENLRDYLYEPYRKLGGNGTAEKIMKEVEKLEIKNTVYKGVD